MFTPQQLIDLPGYGSAKRELIKQGQWHVCADDTERIEWIARHTDRMDRLTDGMFWQFTVSDKPYDAEPFREDIDDAASKVAAASTTKGTHHAPKR